MPKYGSLDGVSKKQPTISVQTTEPTDTHNTLLWINKDTGIPKYWNGTEWTDITVVWG